MQLTEQDKTAIVLRYGLPILAAIIATIEHRAQLCSSDINIKYRASVIINECLTGTNRLVIADKYGVPLIMTLPDHTFISVDEILAMVQHD